MSNHKETIKAKNKATYVINLFLLVLLVILVGANQIIINNTNKKLGINFDIKKEIENKVKSGNEANSNLPFEDNIKLNGDISKDAMALILISGEPKIYGKELRVSYDKVQAAINIMKIYDPYDLQPRGSRIIPQGEDLKRYIDIAGKISCEFCCGAKSIINQNGQYACGCAHSMAMRGLAAYLIKNHGKEMSNDEILRELARWKSKYFPKQMIKKTTGELQSGKYSPDVAVLILGLKLPDYGQGGASAPLPSEIENLPGMVGGCS